MLAVLCGIAAGNVLNDTGILKKIHESIVERVPTGLASFMKIFGVIFAFISLVLTDHSDIREL